MLDNLKKYHVLLASKSPRRRELLAQLRVPFNVVTIGGIKEEYPETLPLEKVPLYLAGLKADRYAQHLKSNELIITADTVVISDNRILGKPGTVGEAKAMLGWLAGKTHEVVTGVVISTSQQRRAFSSHTLVTFGVLSADEIEYYVDNFSPLDKAGAYGIQEWIGCIGVEKIEGSFYNVMGLPVCRLYKELKGF